MKNLVPRKISDKRGGKYHDFPSNFFSHSTKSIRRGMLQCFRKFRVSKKFMPKRGNHELLGKFFGLTVPERSRRGNH